MTYPQSADRLSPDNPQPNPPSNPPSRATRFAVSAGPLNPVRLRIRLAEAACSGVHLLQVFTEAELLHLRLIEKTLPPEATWEDAIAAIRAAGI